MDTAIQFPLEFRTQSVIDDKGIQLLQITDLDGRSHSGKETHVDQEFLCCLSFSRQIKKLRGRFLPLLRQNSNWYLVDLNFPIERLKPRRGGGRGQGYGPVHVGLRR